ncbi:hypothetical protein [Paenibacillus sp. 1P07SE]|uniref:hypothetical protein n=1 Tax=Paenibacillus sp. 1P07SE TaxID=3132209 RepID=UPI0039A7468B
MTYHFREAEVFTAMLADFVPLKLELVHATGILELILAILLLIPAIRRRAGNYSTASPPRVRPRPVKPNSGFDCCSKRCSSGGCSGAHGSQPEQNLLTQIGEECGHHAVIGSSPDN